jgi:hypothetical protein
VIEEIGKLWSNGHEFIKARRPGAGVQMAA